MTPRAAAELLGRSDQTIRNLVKDGKVDGTEAVTESGEHRYYIAQEAVDEMSLEDTFESDTIPSRRSTDKDPPLQLELAERYISSLETHNEVLVTILREMRDQSARASDRLASLHEATQRSYARERRLLRITMLLLTGALIFIAVALLVGVVNLPYI